MQIKYSENNNFNTWLLKVYVVNNKLKTLKYLQIPKHQLHKNDRYIKFLQNNYRLVFKLLFYLFSLKSEILKN